MAHIDKSKSGFRRPPQDRRPRTTPPAPRDEQKREAQERKLDEALDETFPASDPAVSTPRKS